jgi:catechol 2,3-dioxygenase-like lactoylglutathione lyase family enzyme
MPAHLRIARPVTDLPGAVAMYTRGLGLRVLGKFEAHEGFDGAMLGDPGGAYHLELTVCRDHPIRPTPTPEDLLVFYIAEVEDWEHTCDNVLAAGFNEVASFNPYWSRHARTFEDRDGYRLVIHRGAWSSG